MNHLQDWVPAFEKHRVYLLALAFRMTGSLSEAEDLVQDTLLACPDQPLSEVHDPKAWLAKVCSNKALDHLKQAYKKRETYTGPWLPDAVPDSLQIWAHLEEQVPPEKHLMLAESLTTSFLHLAERLNPEERVVFLLNEVFDYSFRDIAAFLDKSEAACRKSAERARKAMIDGRPKFQTQGAEQTLKRFFEIAKTGDKNALQKLLSEKSEFWADGGGKVSAARKMFRNPSQIAAFFTHLATSPVFGFEEFKLDFTRINGRPGLTISRQQPDGHWAFETLLSFEIEDDKISRIYAQRNPDKLKTLLRG